MDADQLLNENRSDGLPGLSAYQLAGARLVDNGFSAIPVMPGTKRPGQYTLNEWRGASDWQRFCDRRPTEIELDFWGRWPNAGVCVAIDDRLKVIDVDTDDPELLAAVLSVLPNSDVKKRGKKGFSAFYKGDAAITSAAYSVGQQRVVDLLCYGRQTVVPPTIHPDTGRPYVWMTADTLHDVDIEELPCLPDNIGELLVNALTPFGYEEPIERQPGQGDTIWSEVNATALLNLSAWVPDLCLPGLHRSGSGYRAVAHWRGVTNANLSFHRDGIRDWGSGESHSAIDVVMKALELDLGNATNFLAERLNIQTFISEDDFDVVAFIERQKNRATRGRTPRA